jgi:penicillin V acylase-like amidase (Ntn superfamily)
MKISIFILFWFFLFLAIPSANACTTFCLNHDDRPVFGRNFDWQSGYGLIIINKRNVTKTATSAQRKALPLTWTSKFGSATFNLFGREFPMGGMNEKGLVVESMGLEATQYPLKDQRPPIDENQWIQYQLDNCATINQVIENDAHLRIYKPWGMGLHFMVCDSSGDCAVIEFLGNEQVVHTKKNMPIKALTNNSYAHSLESWTTKTIPQEDKYQSIERFILTADQVKKYTPKSRCSPVQYSFDVLKSVEHSYPTQWTIVYDVAELAIYFKTLSNQNIRYFRLDSLDLSCKTPVKIMDVNAPYAGNVVERFQNYTYKINRKFIQDAYWSSFLVSLFPHHILDSIAHYPETTFCKE